MHLLKKTACAACLCIFSAFASPMAIANPTGGPLISVEESGASQLSSAQQPDPASVAEVDSPVQSGRSDANERGGKSSGRTRKAREARAVEKIGSRTGDTLGDLMGFNLPSQGL